jgi:GTP pyrophosphokinase
LIQICNHNPTPAGIIEFLKIKENKAKFKFINKSRNTNSKAPILVDGNSDLHVTLANCCSPIPGDDIVGYITKGQGISVHRRNCPNVIRKTERLIDVQWNENLGISSYPVDIEITASDRGELIVDIMNNLSTHKISVSQLNAKVHNSTLTVTVTLTIYVPDSKTLKDVFNVLTNIKGVFKIERVIH